MGRAANRKRNKKLNKGGGEGVEASRGSTAACDNKLEDLDAGRPCPIPKTHARLQEAHRLWHQALDLYADSEGFRANLNACIQALRNVTFVLQKEHSSIPNFETWYAGWRERMKSDSIMRWLDCERR
jgi:hypothetical protein